MDNQYRTLWIALVLLAFGLAGCRARPSGAGPVDSAPSPVGTPLPSADLLFQDDFSNPLSGWAPLGQGGGRAEYADGVYRLRVDGANYNVMAAGGQRFTDARLEVDAFKLPGEPNNRFGLICRVVDAGNLYVFLISSDGFYGIGKIIQNQPSLIGMQALLPSEKIPLGSGLTHLRADCIGSRLALYVNGEKIYEVQDSDLVEGQAGFVAGSYSPQGTEILFDNFQVYNP
jgi:hypothetical protein